MFENKNPRRLGLFIDLGSRPIDRPSSREYLLLDVISRGGGGRPMFS